MVTSFVQFALIIILVLAVSIIMKLLKQPLIIGYILSGILVGPFFLNLIGESETLLMFSEMGIAFLLFIVGLHLSPNVIKEVGKISLITGIGQILFTSIIGYFIGIMFGFSMVTSIYIAIALTFSSTIIIMKLLSDKDALEKLYGKISIGFLLVQDLVAILILIVVSSLASGAGASNLLFSTLFKGILIVGILIPVSRYVLPKLSDFFAKSQELLFIFAISWGFGLSLLFLYIGFSIEVGALIAGIMLSMSPYSFEVSSKLKPLRDFFIISFFIILGSQMAFGDITPLIFPAIVLSIFILIGNPLIVMILMGLFGYSKKTGFMAGLTVAQISEFSLILIALGVKTGALTQEILSFVTIIGLLTIAGSTYMIIYSESIFKKLSGILSIFEKKKIKERESPTEDYEYILLGENRMGFSIMNSFLNMSKKYLIIDFNPNRVKKLCSKGIKCVYGDVSDLEILENLNFRGVKLIVSTVPEMGANIALLRRVKKANKKTIVIVVASQIKEAFQLYEGGADYVVLPHFLGGEYISSLIKKIGLNKKEYLKEKKKQIKDFRRRTFEGEGDSKEERRKK